MNLRSPEAQSLAATRWAARAWRPSALPAASDDLLLRVQQLYANDPQLHALWSAAMDARGMAGPAARQNPAELGQLAARFLSQPQGPRIDHSFEPRHAIPRR